MASGPCKRCAVAVLLLLAASAAAARGLRAEPATRLRASLPTVVRAAEFRARGGALKTLGRAQLGRLKRRARIDLTIEELAAKLDAPGEDLAVDSAAEQLVYVCEGLAVPDSAPEQRLAALAALGGLQQSRAAAEVDAAGSASSIGAADPDAPSHAAVFALHSRPSATRKILLDFDGHNTTKTDWNKGNTRPYVIVSPPYSRDTDRAFSAGELADMFAIWRAVAEDYSAFDVDVTTEDPGDAALIGTGIRIVIGGSSKTWYGGVAGGVAFMNSFGRANTPAFVFPSQLGNGNPKYVWEAASHECGHTLGLWHDGIKNGSAYYAGAGDSNWAPIMGNSYYKPITQFDMGEYNNTDNLQDDFAVMSTYLPLLAQQNGDSLATATPLPAGAPGAAGGAVSNASGVISVPGAGDWFSFEAAAPGPATISAAATAPTGSRLSNQNRANLDIELRLFSADGALLASANPSTGTTSGEVTPATMGAALRADLPAAGTYFVSVSGSGSGVAPAAGGYSSYGSRGAFALEVERPPPLLPSPSPSLDPSPSPEPSPSPSPSPEPSPSPSPALPLALVAGLTIGRTRWAPSDPAGFRCQATITLRDAAARPLRGALVSGTWTVSTGQAVQGFPVTQTFPAATSSAGSLLVAAPRIPSAAGYGCAMTVNNIVLPGYRFDPAAPNQRLTRSVSW